MAWDERALPARDIRDESKTCVKDERDESKTCVKDERDESKTCVTRAKVEGKTKVIVYVLKWDSVHGKGRPHFSRRRRRSAVG